MVLMEETEAEMAVNNIKIDIMKTKSNLNKVLFKLSNETESNVTLREALTHFLVFGQSGSGKSSSTSRIITTSYLKSGMGGLVMSAKKSDSKDFLSLVQKLKEKGIVDRTNDIILFNDESDFYFSPIEYEQKKSNGDTNVYNLINLIFSIYELNKSISGQGGGKGGDSDFWDKSVRRVIKYSIILLDLAKISISFSNLQNFVNDLLIREQYQQLNNILCDSDNIERLLKKWSKSNFFIETLYKATINLSEELDNGNSKKKREYVLARQFFQHFSSISEKTTSIVKESILGVFEFMLTGAAYRHFGKNPTNIQPELCFEGKIIILDWSVKKNGDLGRLLQGIYKWQWMKAIEQRTYNSEKDLPVFLIADECQYFINEFYDHKFLSTCRSVGASVLNITQNINSLYAEMGGASSTAKVKNLIGNYGIRFYHSNLDYETNEFAALSIGKIWKRIIGHGVSSSSGASTNLSPQNIFQVEPREFSELINGGAINDFKTEVIVTVAGKSFGGKNYLKTQLKQILL